MIPTIIDDPINNHHNGTETFSRMKVSFWTIPSYYDILYQAQKILQCL